mgnify:FL=1
MTTEQAGTVTASPRKVFIKTWGCQMNVYDSDRMLDVLKPLGYGKTEAPDEADLIILNTCHIREKATEKLFSELGRLRVHKDAAKARGAKPILAVAGCVAQAEGEEIPRRAPYVDLVFGPQTYHELPEMISALGGRPVVRTSFPEEPKFDRLPAQSGPVGPTAFLSVQEGCNKFCSFCVVPYTRGAEYSRPVADVLAEARHLAGAGVREVTLLGQNVNAYHGVGPDGDTWGLGQLLFALASVPSLGRLRYTTSHPNDMDDTLIAAHRDLGSVMPYLHLPIQSGSDRILAAMNRKHTRDDYRRVIDQLRAACPALALSSDFIVGYPGETDADFQDTLDLVREVEYAQAYSFKYSRRPGTPAATQMGQVTEPVKDERLQALQALLNQQAASFNRAQVGATLPVLFDRRGRAAGQLVGRSPFLQAVHVSAPPRLLGEIVPVLIDSATANSLAGRVALVDEVSTGREAS